MARSFELLFQNIGIQQNCHGTRSGIWNASIMCRKRRLYKKACSLFFVEPSMISMCPEENYEG